MLPALRYIATSADERPMHRRCLFLCVCVLPAVACFTLPTIRASSGLHASRRRAPLLAADEAAALSPDQLEALDEVSRSLKQCGDTLTKLGSKRSFYQAVYAPGEVMGTWVDPTTEDWDSVRAEWPQLADCSDKVLVSYLPTLRANQRDFRSLKFDELNITGPHSVRGR